jgi:hypothetical protein
MAIRKDLDEITPPKTIMVVGNRGKGKSTFAATAPQPLFVFDFDRKITSYRTVEDLSYATYPISSPGWAEFEKDFREVSKMAKEGAFQTIVFDSATSFTDLAMERALQLDPTRDMNGPQWNIHYKIVRNLVEPKYRQLISLPCTIIVICHLEIKTDQKSGATLAIQPLLGGQLAIKVPGYFEEVYLANSRTVVTGKDTDKKKTTHYYLKTVPQGLFEARSTFSGRENLLPEEIPNDYPTLMALYKKGVDALSKKTK